MHLIYYIVSDPEIKFSIKCLIKVTGYSDDFFEIIISFSPQQSEVKGGRDRFNSIFQISKASVNLGYSTCFPFVSVTQEEKGNS
ncbi:hypothetical protein CEXT_89801 [Caerostris extrusa]|uniref:Uncharacterized protein n=1 Tax=Caerostris extrusa TaxID=172846 RepID=A0AAV4X385_CAEEX|nr:hypothetical protein CEXT_89801 [Caerostris extrusa]